MKFSPVIEAWLMSYPSTDTRKAYRARITQLAQSLNGVAIEAATAEQVAAAAEEYQRWSPQMSNRTWNQWMSAVRSCYRSLMNDARIIKADPSVYLRRRPEPDDIQPTPEEEEVQKMWGVLISPKVWKASSDAERVTIRRDRAIFSLLVCVGLRNKEVCSLKCDAFDMKRRVIVARTKGGKVQRKMWPEEVHEYIADHVLRQDPDGYIFPNRDHMPISKEVVNGMLEYICEAAGTEKYTAHAFKRFYITAGLRAKIPVDQVCRDVGHKNTRTTIGYSADRNTATDATGAAAAKATLPKATK